MNFKWGVQTFELDVVQTLTIGNLELSFSRSVPEWTTEYHYHQDRYVNEGSKETTRFRTVAKNDELRQLEVLPATADRNVVVRPAQRIQIPHGERVELFIGTPVWLQASTPEGKHKLVDLPVEILSDTWFGANTRVGEICYANQTQARLDLDKLSQRPERLITPVSISNDGGDTLVIERLNLPVPYLSVYDTGPSLWTQQIEIIRTGKLETAELHFSVKPPEQFPDALPINTPRLSEADNLVVRAMGLLFDERKST